MSKNASTPSHGRSSRWTQALLLSFTLGASLLVAQAASERVFQPATSTPAMKLRAPERGSLQAVVTAGQRLVAVGLRGLVVYSDDNGQSWTQAQVPVDSDLVAVTFPTPEHGWAVGHQGVVLESSDSGASWKVRFADLALTDLAIEHYQADSGNPAAARALAEAQANRDIEAAFSLLDIQFDSPTSGTLVGSFNTIFRTSDGGQTWQPWMDRTDNPDLLNFYAIEGDANGLYLSGERGMVWRLDAAKQHWVAVPTGYTGTLFGLLVNGPQVVAYGMRGSVYHSDNGGAQWQPVATGQKAGILDGIRLSDGSLVLADQAGSFLRSTDGGRSFAPASSERPTVAFSFGQTAQGQLLSAGPFGVSPLTLK